MEPTDDVAATEPVAGDSHAFWRAAFGGSEVLGRRLVLNCLGYVITGVMLLASAARRRLARRAPAC